jgi:hypothetical protein
MAGCYAAFADRIHLASPRRNGTAAFMDRSGLDDKSAPFQGEAKGFAGRGQNRFSDKARSSAFWLLGQIKGGAKIIGASDGAIMESSAAQ